MKAITLTQPWATLVAIGAKRIETRSWKTEYRGPLAIHAAKGYPKECARLCLEEPFLSVLKGAGLIQFGVWFKSNDDLPHGAVVATCELVACVPIDYVSRWYYPVKGEKNIGYQVPPSNDNPEFAFGDYTPGRWAWLLNNIKPLPEPIPVKGALSLWEWTP
jgi:hypothetical protein